MTRLGIMGGTFDPVHHGHLVTAEEARVQFGLSRVLFVPNNQAPHKDPVGITLPEHRYLMTFLATASNPQFNVSRLEIDRPGPSLTIDTIRALTDMYPSTELFYITGTDAILQILRGEWERSEELLATCQFIAASRPGFAIDKEVLQRVNCTGSTVANVHLISIPALAISSTEIRERVASGRPIRYLLPEPVEAYIHKHGLYLGRAGRGADRNG